ncbi:MAG: hypothetical protein ACRC6X_08230 [Culicoidibacterales bacterium]
MNRYAQRAKNMETHEAAATKIERKENVKKNEEPIKIKGVETVKFDFVQINDDNKKESVGYTLKKKNIKCIEEECKRLDIKNKSLIVDEILTMYFTQTNSN